MPDSLSSTQSAAQPQSRSINAFLSSTKSLRFFSSTIPDFSSGNPCQTLPPLNSKIPLPISISSLFHGVFSIFILLNFRPMALLFFPRSLSIACASKFTACRRRNRCSCSLSAQAPMTTTTGRRSGSSAILWFKQDLRVDDHPGLVQASKYPSLVPLYVFDRRILSCESSSSLAHLLFSLLLLVWPAGSFTPKSIDQAFLAMEFECVLGT